MKAAFAGLGHMGPLACKDLGLTMDLTRTTGVPVPVSAAVEQVYRQARARYGDTGGEMLPVKRSKT
jgi:3-hydroxyisobutyrate dehydrogenase